MSRATITLALLSLTAACADPPEPATLELWNGERQSVGRSGIGQPDFNVMGVATGESLVYRLNGGPPRAVERGEGQWGFRRLGSHGHFNIELPVEALIQGENRVELIAESLGITLSKELTLERLDGVAALPCALDWSEVPAPHHVGQAVDGEWTIEANGLRSRTPLYDRLFLIGDATWTDYEVRTTLTVHRVPDETGPKSGGPGVGFILRFQGHTVAPPRFPAAEPKWGYQPFGAITWLRFSKDDPRAAPVRQFYSGDRDASEDFAALEAFRAGATYSLRARCETDPTDPATTRYRLSVRAPRENGPAAPGEAEWDYTVSQTSQLALTSGGVALVVHHLDVTFGDIEVLPLD